ncbi:MAG: hydroxymethylbilane synthase [Alphaproteobacteria bacterium]|nr:hydroxymethylbilane synthase [Alphaproteobacteria bacterium]
MNKVFKIGTRGSPLAMVQANSLKQALGQTYPNLKIEIIPIRTSADWKKSDGEKSLNANAGGKGQFATEIEDALLKGDVDCGVHSLKDMASELPDGLVLSHVLPRADARDAFISAKYTSLSDLPQGATLGTCSVRRAAIALHHRPDLKIVPFRGNVGTRLEKIEQGQVEATFLAMAGLTRLGIDDEMIHPLSPQEMLPACGQGIVCMEIRDNDQNARELLQAVHCEKTGFEATAERAVLRTLDGSCHTPVAAYAQITSLTTAPENQGQDIILEAMILSLDGQKTCSAKRHIRVQNESDADKIGQELGQELKDNAPEGSL